MTNATSFLTVAQEPIDQARKNALCKLQVYSQSPDRKLFYYDTKIRNLVTQFFKEAGDSLNTAISTRGDPAVSKKDFEFRIWFRMEKLKPEEFHPL